MNDRRHAGNASLLALLTAAIASCGGTGTVNTGGAGGAGGHGSSSSTGGAGVTSSSSSGAGTGGSMSASSSGTGGSAPASSSGAGGAGGSMSASSGGAGGGGGSVSASSSSTSVGGSPRRPFLVGASLRSAGVIRRDDWSRRLAPPEPLLDAVTSNLLAEVWLKDALEEHASVAAFARFTMHLLSVGAPPDLVIQSQRASLDEVRHARACFALAERYGAGALGPARLAVHDAMEARSLASIAALAAEEGGVGETLGAALAREQLAHATDPEAARALRRIAADEARHAELAWKFLRWAALVGGEEVRRAISASAERAIEGSMAVEIRSHDGIDLAAFHAHGRLTCVEARASSERAIREIVRPCLAAALADVGERGAFDLTRSATV